MTDRLADDASGDARCPAQRLADEAGVKLVWSDFSEEEYAALLRKSLRYVKKCLERESERRRRLGIPVRPHNTNAVGGLYEPSMRSLIEPYKAEDEAEAP